MPGNVNLAIYQGDDYQAQVTVLNADGSIPDLTGYSAQSQIRPVLGDTSPTPSAQFTCTIAANVITMVLTHDQTKVLNLTSYVWDIQLIDTSGWITTILAGAVTVTLEV